MSQPDSRDANLSSIIDLDVPSIEVDNAPDDLSIHSATPTSSTRPHFVSLEIPTPNISLLSPQLNRPGRASLEVPYSPTLAPSSGSPSGSIFNDIASLAPPSPTLSTRSSAHSVQFLPQTSLALRDLKHLDGSHYLSPRDYPSYQHRRKGSIASSMTGSVAETEPDSHSHLAIPLTLQRTGGDESTVHSPTHTHYEPSDADGGTTVRSPSQSRSKVSGKERPPATHEEDTAKETPQHLGPDLTKDQDIDTGSFAFKPHFLASLVDPKKLDDLTSIGGTTGLCRGLGTSRKHGLSKKALTRDVEDVSHHGLIPESKDTDGRPGMGGGGAVSGAGEGASQRHDRGMSETETAGEAVPGIVVIGPGGEHGGEHMEDGADEKMEEGQAYEASLDERQRVYGENVLPSRKSKSLLQLMWLALKDKVLVSVN